MLGTIAPDRLMHVQMYWVSCVNINRPANFEHLLHKKRGCHPKSETVGRYARLASRDIISIMLNLDFVPKFGAFIFYVCIK